MRSVTLSPLILVLYMVTQACSAALKTVAVLDDDIFLLLPNIIVAVNCTQSDIIYAGTKGATNL